MSVDKASIVLFALAAVSSGVQALFPSTPVTIPLVLWIALLASSWDDLR